MTLSEITQSEQFTNLTLDEKNKVVDHYFSVNPDSPSSGVKHLIGLDHNIANGNRVDSSAAQRRRDLFLNITEESRSNPNADMSALGKQLLDGYASIEKQRLSSTSTRRDNLTLSRELAQLRKSEADSIETNDSLLRDISPFHHAGRVIDGVFGGDFALDADTDSDLSKSRRSRISEIEKELTDQNLDEDLFNNLIKDGEDFSKEDELSFVDTDSEVQVPNLGELLQNPENTYKSIRSHDLSPQAKARGLARADSLRKAVIFNAFYENLRNENVTLDSNGNPKISAKYGATGVLAEVFSDGHKEREDLSDKFFRQDDHPAKLVREEFTQEQMEKAVLAELEQADGNVNNLVIGADQGSFGLMYDATNSAGQLTAGLFGDDEAVKDIDKFQKEINGSRQALNSLANITPETGGEKISNVIGRAIPGVILTRGVGSTALKFGASEAAASRFAIAFGASQSAQGNIRRALDADPTNTGGALLEGFKGFATTYLVSAGVGKIGDGKFGGVESFRRNAQAGAKAFSDQLKAVSAAAVGEGMEEFIDEFVNSLIQAEYNGKQTSIDGAIDQAYYAGIAGLLLGGGNKLSGEVADGISNKFNPDQTARSDRELKVEADAAADSLRGQPDSTDTTKIQDLDVEITKLENLESLGEQDAELLQDLYDQKEALVEGTAPEADPILAEEIDLDVVSPENSPTPEPQPTLSEEIDLDVVSPEVKPIELEQQKNPQPVESAQEQEASANVVEKDTEESSENIPTDTEDKDLVEDLNTPESVADVDTKKDASGDPTNETFDTVGGDEFFHGSSRPITSLDEGQYTTLNYFGQGFYTTDSFRVANGGYTKKGGGDDPRVYKATFPEDAKFYNIEEPVSDGMREALEKASDELSGDFNTVRDLYDSLRDEPFMSADEVQEYFGIISEVVEREGYSGIQHKGGGVTGKRPHTVRIQFEPQTVKIDETDESILKSEQNLTVAKKEVKLEEDTKPSENLDLLRDDTFEMSDDIFESSKLDVSVKNRITKGISDAKTSEELNAIQKELVDIMSPTSRPVEDNLVDSDPTPVEQISVKRFREFANADQEFEFFNRVAEEDAATIVSDIANRDGIDNFKTIDELVADVDRSESGKVKRNQVKLYGGFALFDPDLIKDTAHSVYKIAKDFVGFSKRMINLVGEKIKPFLRNYFNDLKKNKGEIKDDRPSPVIDEPTVDTVEDQEQAAFNDSLGNTVVDTGSIPIPNWLVPVRDRRESKEASKQKSTVLSSADSMAKLLSNITGSYVEPLQLQSQLDYAPMLPLASFAHTIASLEGVAVGMQARLKDLSVIEGELVRVEDNGNRSLDKAVVPKEDGEQSLRPSDVLEALSENPDSYTVIDDRIFQFVEKYKELNNYLIKVAEEKGMPLGDFASNDGKVVDIGLVNDNHHATRGAVYHKDMFDNPTGSPKYVAANQGTSAPKQRVYTREQDGVDHDYIYPLSMTERLVHQYVGFVQNAAQFDLVSDSAFRSVAKRPETVITKETIDLDSGDTVVEKSTFNRKLGTKVLTMGAFSMRVDQSDYNRLKPAIDRLTTANPLVKRISDVSVKLSVATLSSDFSAVRNQAALLMSTSPKLTMKAIGTTMLDFVGKPKSYLKLLEDEFHYYKLFVNHGGDMNLSVEDFGDTNTALKSLEKPTSKMGVVYNKISDSKFNLVSTLYRKSQRAQGMLQSAIALLNFKSDVLAAKSRGDELTPELLSELAKLNNNSAGRENLSRYGVSKTAQDVQRGVVTAAGMYVAGISIVTDLKSDSPRVRKYARARLGIHLAVTNGLVLGMGLAFDASNTDDEDFETRLKRLGKRLVPGDPDYLSVDVEMGGGIRRMSLGAFHRGLFNAVGQTVRAGVSEFTEGEIEGARGDGLIDFAFNKGRGSLHMIHNLRKQEDFLGNPATTFEIIRDSQTPIAFKGIVESTTDSMALFLQKELGLGLVTESRISQKQDLDWSANAFDFALNFFGEGGYQKGAYSVYAKKRDDVSSELFAKSYSQLSLTEAVEVNKGMAEVGISKPKFDSDRMGDIFKNNREDLKNNIGRVRFNNIDKNLQNAIPSLIPRYVSVGDDKVRVYIPDNIREEISTKFYSKVNTSYDQGMRRDELQEAAEEHIDLLRSEYKLPKVNRR